MKHEGLRAVSRKLIKLLDPTRGRLPSSVAFILAVSATGIEATQQVANTTPTSYRLVAVDTLPADFTRIAGIRELSDGTLLVADAVESVIKVLRPGADTAGFVGRVGQGPGEWYRQPWDLFILSGDSTAVNDLAGSRLLFMDGAVMTGKVAGGSGAFVGSAVVIGADTIANGHWLVSVGSITRGQALPDGGRATTFSKLIVRYTRDMASADTVATIDGGTRSVRSSRGSDRIGMVAGTPEEDALGYADGWIAFALHEPYRVDWLSPDGRWVRGPVLRVESGAADADTLYSFRPMQIPALARAPDGRLLVRRTTPEGSQNVRYDVIDRQGRLNGFFLVDANEVVLGSGRQMLYISTEDSLGLIRIYRAVWPPTAQQ